MTDQLDALKASAYRHVSAVLGRDATIASSNPTLQVGRLSDCVVRSGNVNIPLMGAQQVTTRYLQAMFQQDYPQVDCIVMGDDEGLPKGIYVLVPIADELNRTTVAPWTVRGVVRLLLRIVVGVLLMGLIDLLLISHGRYFGVLMRALGVAALCELTVQWLSDTKRAVLLWLLGNAR